MKKGDVYWTTVYSGLPVKPTQFNLMQLNSIQVNYRFRPI